MKNKFYFYNKNKGLLNDDHGFQFSPKTNNLIYNDYENLFNMSYITIQLFIYYLRLITNYSNGKLNSYIILYYEINFENLFFI